METKIADYKTFQILYDPQSRHFIAKNADGDEVGTADSQSTLEKQLDALAKHRWTFPIRAFDSRNLIVTAGRITSLNPEERTFYFVADEDEVSGPRRFTTGRTKGRLTSSSLYEVTPRNEEIFVKVNDKRKQVKKLEEEITELQEGFEKKIDLEYFGLPAARY